MIVKEKPFQMSEEELVVLNAFFLALPLPPMMANNEDTASQDLRETLQKATQSLREKGWLSSKYSESQSELVIPNLAEMLRNIAYGNQLAHLYYQPQGKSAHQIAFYRRADRVVGQELTSKGEHTIYPAGDEMGRDLLEKFLSSAPAGKSGAKTQIPLTVWHSLVSVRAAGNQDVMLADFEEAVVQTADEDANIRLAFAQDVLTASLVIEVTCIYDRIKNEKEKASFVLTDKTNWLVFSTSPVSGQERLLVVQAARTDLYHTAAGLYAPFSAGSDLDRERS